MNLKQIRYLCEIVDRGFNLTRVAEALHTSQPGISKQVQLLEEELGAKILERKNTRVSGLTRVGREILPAARRMLLDATDFTSKAREAAGRGPRHLIVATTHTHARYSVLPAFKIYREKNPRVMLELRQASPTQIAELVAAGKVDIGIATEPLVRAPGVSYVECYRMEHVVVVPQRHPLLRCRRLKIEDIARHPIVTYDSTFRFGRVIRERFRAHNAELNIAVNAIDSDIAKAYVEAGFGIAVLPLIVWDPAKDRTLRVIPASHLFEASICHVMTLEGRHLESYKREFIAHVQLASARLARNVALPRRRTASNARG
jgi:LysR family cys regulon transcriptional activator